jgi:hypothetical protein
MKKQQNTVNDMNNTRDAVKKPIKRSAFRITLGTMYYGMQRYMLWAKMNS